MEIKTLYICSKVKEHVFREKTETGTCTRCPANHFSFLTKVMDSNPIFPELLKELEKQDQAENIQSRFDEFITKGDDYLSKQHFEDAMQMYTNALNLNENNTLANDKIEKCTIEWEKCRKESGEEIETGTFDFELPEEEDQNNEYGLCVLLMDASGSMEEKPFEESSYTKKELIAKTAAHGIFDLKDNHLAKNAFIVAFKFDNNIKPLIPLNSIANIVNAYRVPENLEHYILSELNRESGTTDINGALKVAYQQAYDFIQGNLKGLLGDDYNVMYHAVTDTQKGKNIQIPNVRVFLYTDGLQYVNGKSDPLINPFAKSKEFGVDILMGGYFGPDSDEGSEELERILSYCPEHNEKNFFLFDKPDKIGTLRNLFRMASGASGFCPKCLEKQEKDRTNK
ncbi:vWA domain-containing protein [Porphyromonas gingivalis]|uniref:VWA domain-containing protein n=1 Tax=Porphyromonas gingivalis TaxID=837 RepID=A0AAE9XBR3_PORGN|nr:vWA domain-containing protein [Porphyromonas gingivalis]WCF98077.1 VWA domain-containing protein [Porphyromonas gingivalis]